MTGLETAGLVIAAANAIAAVTAAAGIWHGIRAMVRANKDRAGILDQQREVDERRHAEAMRAADRRRALEALIGGMETMIGRTAPKFGPKCTRRISAVYAPGNAGDGRH